MSDELEPLSVEIKFKGCPYRDNQELKMFFFANEIHSMLIDIDQEIRNRLKYTEGLSDDECRFLEGLRESMDIWKYE